MVIVVVVVVIVIIKAVAIKVVVVVITSKLTYFPVPGLGGWGITTEVGPGG